MGVMYRYLQRRTKSNSRWPKARSRRMIGFCSRTPIAGGKLFLEILISAFSRQLPGGSSLVKFGQKNLVSSTKQRARNNSATSFGVAIKSPAQQLRLLP